MNYINNQLGVEFQVGTYKDGKITWKTDKVNNLVTDWGMYTLDKIWFADISKYILLGTSATPNRIPVRVIQDGTSVTIDTISCTNRFDQNSVTGDAAMNRLLIYPDGQQARITNVTSSTCATVNNSINKPNITDAYICHVDQSTLRNGLLVSNNYDTDGCSNSVEYDIAGNIIIKNTRSVIFNEGSIVGMDGINQDLKFNEIGWAPFLTNATSEQNSNVFGRRVMAMYFNRGETPYVRVSIYRKIFCNSIAKVSIPIFDHRTTNYEFNSINKFMFDSIHDTTVAIEDSPIWDFCSKVDIRAGDSFGGTVPPTYSGTLLECSGFENRYLICSSSEDDITNYDMDFNTLPSDFSDPIAIRNKLQVVDHKPAEAGVDFTSGLYSTQSPLVYFGTDNGRVFSREIYFNESSNSRELIISDNTGSVVVESDTEADQHINDIKELPQSDNDNYIVVITNTKVMIYDRMLSAYDGIALTEIVTTGDGDLKKIIPVTNTKFLIDATDKIYTLDITDGDIGKSLSVTNTFDVDETHMSDYCDNFVYILTNSGLRIYNLALDDLISENNIALTFIPKTIDAYKDNTLYCSGTIDGNIVFYEIVSTVVDGSITAVNIRSNFSDYDLEANTLDISEITGDVLCMYRVDKYIYVVHTEGVLSISVWDINIKRRTNIYSGVIGSSFNKNNIEILLINNNLSSIIKDMVNPAAGAIVDICTLDLDSMSDEISSLRQIAIAVKDGTHYKIMYTSKIYSPPIQSGGNNIYIQTANSVLAEFTVLTKWNRMP